MACYTQDDIIELKTSDEKSLWYSKAALRTKFDHFDNQITDYPDLKVFNVDLTQEDLSRVLYFSDTLITPLSKNEWLPLLKAADFLLINNTHEKILISRGRKFLESKKIHTLATISLGDLIIKFIDRTFVTKEELAEKEKKIKEEIGRLSNESRLSHFMK